MSDQLGLFDDAPPPEPTAFGSDRPLPRASTLIEASAGTGKTHTLTNLAADYLQSGEVNISQLLMVTYTRAAAAELRDRLRRVLHERLADAESPEIQARLRGAIEEFDTGTITTIHGFCQQVLTTLGVNVPLDPASRLLADDQGLIGQIAADLLASEALAQDAAPTTHQDLPGGGDHDAGDRPGELPKAGRLAATIAAAAARPGIALAGHPDTPEAHLLKRLTEAGLNELNRRLAQRSLVTYQHLLDRVANAVDGPRNRGVIDLLRARFRVALIDEFQDTDPVQWEIFRSVFAGGTSADGPVLVLVGDPKQAIYSFRGADIGTYLAASAQIGHTRSLDTNWRSTPQLIDALNSLFAGSTFGSAPGDDSNSSIGYSNVAHAHDAGNPVNAPTLPGPALAFRCFDLAAYERDHPPAPTPTGKPGTTPAALIKHVVALDLVAEVRATLNEGVAEEDITVLVTSNRDAQRLQSKLTEAGVRAVLGRAGSVVDSPAAQQVRRLLWAMERPSSADRVRGAALGWFFGYRAEEVAAMAADEPTDPGSGPTQRALAQVQEQLRDDAQLLRRRGVAELAHRLRCRAKPPVSAESGLHSGPSTLGTRLLTNPGGERHLTDLAHLWELLSERTGARGTSASSVLEALIESSDPEQEATEVLQRRTEADGGAVTVMTVHVSKGLENRVVMVPYMWGTPMNLRKPIVGHLPDEAATVLAVEHVSKSPIYQDAKAAHEAEGDRLAYVALTRARERLVVWAAPGARGSERSRLMTRLAQRSGQAKLTDLQGFSAAVEAVRSDSDPAQIGLETFVHARATDSDAERDGGVAHTLGALKLAAWDRHLGPPRRRWSFSALTADHAPASAHATSSQHAEDATGRGDEGADDEGSRTLGSETEDGVGAATDERAAGVPRESRADGPDPASSPRSGLQPDPWTDLGAGTAFGSLVHEVLEVADLQASDPEANLGDAIAEHPAAADLDQPRLARALLAAATSPMGGSLGSLSLAGLSSADQLRELDFDLPLEGACRPTGADLAQCVDAWLPDDDPLAGRTFSLGAPASLPLAGMLTGSIDLVIRHRGDDGDRYVVADYKTNLLAPWGTDEPEAAHPDRLVDAMVAHDYPLQAMLYEVALHRYLRWRLPGYDPAVNLGGAAYLFLRGMTGPDTPATSDGRRYGVFTWEPPAGLIVALSDLLAGSELDAVTP